jgi:hypothetical protein
VLRRLGKFYHQSLVPARGYRLKPLRVRVRVRIRVHQSLVPARGYRLKPLRVRIRVRVRGEAVKKEGDEEERDRGYY